MMRMVGVSRVVEDDEDVGWSRMMTSLRVVLAGRRY